MSDTAKRNARNRSAGKAWERAIEQGARELGFDADRTRDTGTFDQGDLAIRVGGQFVIVEAKNAAFQPGPFVEEALVEAKHFAELRNLPADRVHPVVFVKRRGVGGIERAFALTTIGEYLRLVKAAAS
ncbi:MAG: hypothetical protein ACRCYU_12325 [Nocardioides sp.]